MRQRLAKEIDLLGEPETEAGKAKMGEFKRGPGRPRGARNKLVLHVAERLVAKYGDPRERMMALLKMHTADVAALLKCSMHEAWIEQRLAFAAVAPFVVSRMPLAVSLSSHKIVELHISTGDVPAEASHGDVVTVPARVVEVIDQGEGKVA